MKKFLAVLLVFVCLCGFVVNVSAEEESVNLVSAINSGFEASLRKLHGSGLTMLSVIQRRGILIILK